MMHHFRHKLYAATTIKERFVWVLYLGVLFFLLYGSANQFAHITEPHPSIIFSWEGNIPFIDIFIIPYMSSDILFVIALMLPQKRFELRVLAVRIVLAIAISCLVFVLFPLSFSFEKPAPEHFVWLFDLLQADLPYNQLPSLHISLAIIIWESMRKNISSSILKGALFIWIILIMLSTLFVYQHHFIDLPTGALVGIACVYLVPYKKYTKITEKFMTPRHLKMSLYYIATATISIIIAFMLANPFSLLFVFLFFSMLALSIVYAFGFESMLGDQRFFILFLPYFIGNYISWLYYKKHLPLISKFENNLYFGRYPTSDEYHMLKNNYNIDLFINLASDMKFNKYYKPDITFDLLDMTIQNPQKLEEIYKFIKENRDKKIFIHCKFGLSRTIITLMHYLKREKNMVCEAVIKEINRISSGYQIKKYMKINCALIDTLIHKG
jgi:membrane-associated phospholipid phosphatase